MISKSICISEASGSAKSRNFTSEYAFVSNHTVQKERILIRVRSSGILGTAGQETYNLDSKASLF
ncbi:Protein of unknown function [Pyronema omphalodes CBS 100304]|uniref:Uncharacterized protein n=1 Tax=Pyronema omphalodes (strain CBS 100304) TaxID=1076935 RepID=U4LAH8_PYROM|nr:Protein of unknown function [Pyronema omphalodes CBS 100304]